MGSAPISKIVTFHALGDVPGVQHEILKAVESRGFGRNAIFAIRLALDEALTNAVRHGNEGDPAKSVTADYRVSDEELRVTICDQGPGFAPGNLPDCTAAENLDRPCGRGVLLMRAYMTQVTFNESGNCVTLVKARGCTKPHKDQAEG